jgi:hypothetical protein
LCGQRSHSKAGVGSVPEIAAISGRRQFPRPPRVF